MILANAIRRIVAVTGGPRGLSQFGMTEESVPKLVEGAMQQHRLLSGAPRSVTQDDLAAIVRASL